MTKPLPTVTPTSLRAITGWTILANVFIYAWAYYISKDAVGKIATQHKAGLADLEAWLFVSQAVGALVVGIIVDSIGTRAAINLTHLGSLTIYVGATILQMDAAEQRRLGFKPELLASLPFAIRAATALQHTMMATQIAVCVGAWRSQAKTFILLIVVNLFYQAGSLCAGPLRSWLPTVAERETTAAAAALTACAFVWNFFITFPSTTITRRALQVNGGTQLVTLRPPRAALPTIIFRTLPALALVVALRLGRLVVMEFRSSMSPSASPLGGFIPASVPVDTALQITSYFVVLILALFSNGPGAFALLVPGVLVFTRAATVFDPAAVARQVDVFYVALGLLCGVLYMLPNAIVGTAASPGQKGRAMGLAAAASVFVFQYNAQLRAWVLQTVKIYAPRFTALSLSASELDFVVTGLLFSLAIILAPVVIRTADATDASFRAVNGKTFKEVSAEPAQRAAADSAAAGRTASPTGNSGLKHRKAH